MLALLVAGCGGHARASAKPKPRERSPESVVRAWSAALNSGNNEAAARLFARNAEVKQGPLDAILRTHRSAVVFNASLPCSGRIVGIVRDGAVVTATFVLGPRPSGPLCTGPGQEAAAAFTVRHGKIVRWEQVPPPTAYSA